MSDSSKEHSKSITGKLPFRPRDEPDDYMPPVRRHWLNKEVLRSANMLPDVLSIAEYDNEGFERDEPAGITLAKKVTINPREYWIKRHDPGVKVRPMDRVSYSTSGKETVVLTNAWPILAFPKKPVYQYEVNLHHNFQDEEDRRALKRAFNCKTRREKLPDAIFDGARTAWSTHYFGELYEVMKFTGGKTRMVGTRQDLHGVDVEVRFICRRKVYLNVINAWLQKKRVLDEYVIDGLNFLDHLLRHGPSQKQTVQKRAFFFNTLKDHPETSKWERDFEFGLHGGKDAYGFGPHGFATCYQGVIQMIRPCVSGLLLNVDTAHAVFWPRANLLWISRRFVEARTVNEYNFLHPTKNQKGERELSQRLLRLDDKLRRLRVTPDNYPSKFNGSYTIKRVVNQNAEEYMIDYKDGATGKVTKMSVDQYYLKRYNYELDEPQAVLVEMDRHGVVFPLECLKVEKLQRWESKLTDVETANMIKFTAKKPSHRLDMIRKCKGLLDHGHDPHLLNYGLHIGKDMIKTKARLLPNPEIQFGNGKHNPGTSGRWDLRNRKFLKANKRELSHWGIGYWSGRPGFTISGKEVEAWLETFLRIYRGHGGQRCADTVYGVPSQVLQSKRVIGNSPQYSSNVSMKINAKLGGVTSRVNPSIPRRGLPPKSAIIGADVTHPSAGVLTPSLVGMCISNDINGVSYMGNGEGNGDRVEIIKEVSMRIILKPLILEWANTLGGGKYVPEKIYYFRDGVSESEYVEILNKEVPSLRRLIGECQAIINKDPDDTVWRGKILVVIANKRHHLRVWPNPKDLKAADKNGNPVPGTLIDRDVTSPHGYDFLLYSHLALQGTARPVHYKVMMDEIGLKPEELQNMIYEQCYQYIRSTTPVSVHPAIYYAHLITARARHHECFDPSDGPRSGAKVNPMTPRPPRGDPKEPKEFLMTMKGTAENRLPYTMWWI
ncbi:hypothetical protein N7470_002057 [Penicillium chermesinum]|nr:hypothetical protein N7470_002057 [Penicillium chermesinum]